MRKRENHKPRKGPQKNQPAKAYQPAKPTKPPHRTPPKAREYTVQEPAELLSFLLNTVENMGRNSIKSALARGQISVNGQAITAYNHPLQPGQVVSLSKEKIVEAPPFVGLSILHEDDDIIVIHKEAGLLSIASEHEKEMTAYHQLTTHVRLQHPSNRIFVVHRLDRDTSGVMMFAKKEDVKQLLQNNWKEIVHERSYVALVEGKVRQPEGTISSWLKEMKTLKMYSSPYPNDGQHAVTHYKTLEANSAYSLLEVHLETGRKNQIRVHMEDLGHPIVGDKKYGAKSRGLGRLGLHARILAFSHPTTGAPMRFDTGIPKPFTRLLQQDGAATNKKDRR
ncbi:RluA family pseudouridine synthase [Paenibacillus alvei]|uniref:RluA family pseudouridine synthase n=1 Tax=Paenibacillus alvei TaxID=44250 RepID=UPI0013DBB47B|nr:RluA family pseudouridine synthase [Paenibacillus alvei]NEZ45181.1 RluA family pseudouridine synthase [Paenibacillus alvei]